MQAPAVKDTVSGPVRVLYFNGLGFGRTRKRERFAIRYLQKQGIAVTHAGIDWYAGESFESLFARMADLTKEQLEVQGKLTLVGSSAGGSLAVNILGKLHDPNLAAVTLCSRLNEQPLPTWDRRALQRMALDRKLPSRAFHDSVLHCTNTTIPKLTEADKQRIVTVLQWADDVVPRSTMYIPGVRAYQVPALGHGWGIAAGVRRLPRIVRMLE